MSLEDAELQLWLDIQAGEFERAYAGLTRLLTIVDEPLRRGRLESAHGVLLQRVGMTADAHTRFARALDLVAGSDPDRAFVLAIMSLASALNGELDRARVEAEEAVRLGEAEGNSFAVGQAHSTLALVHLGSSRPHEALASSDRALVAQGEASDAAEYRSLAHVMRGLALGELDRFEEGHAAVADGLRVAEPVGHMGQLAYFRSTQALMHFVSGQWDEARAEADAALEDAERTGVLVARGVAWGVAGCIEGLRGNISEAAELIELATSNRMGPTGGIGEEWVALARAAVAADRSTAYDALCDAWFRMRGVPFQLAWKICGHPLVAMALEQGDVAMAEAVNAGVQTGAERARGVASAEGTALCCRASLHGSRELMDEGIALLRKGGRPWPLAYACRAGARLALAEGDTAHALALLNESADVFHRLGATTWSAAVTREIVRVGAATPAPPAELTAAWESLTDAESRVARLAIRGLTNPEIAELLGVSARTVQTQLASARARLGVTSRVELAGRYAFFGADDSGGGVSGGRSTSARPAEPAS